MQLYIKFIRLSILITNIILASGCATKSNPIDPYENINRKIFYFNAAIDKTIVRPTAVVYKDYVPTPLQSAINNFFNNLRDFVSLGNHILQLKGLSIMHTTMRISINTVFGIGGIIDVSSSLGLQREQNTFGNTLKTYGWKNSSYIVLPLIGSSTVRDGIAVFPDIYFNPSWYLFKDWVSITLFSTQLINTRANFIGIDTQIEQMSLDPYVTVRDLYLQSRGQDTQETESEATENDIFDNEYNEQ